MYKFKFALIFMLFSFLSFGQTVHNLTIDEAVKIALENAENIKNLQIDEEIQFSKNKEIEGSALPQISANGQLSYYFYTPQIQFPNSNFGIYEVLQKEGVKDATGNPIDVSKATFSTQNVSFFAPLNMQFGIGVNQLLFQPDIFVAFKAREEVLNLAKGTTMVEVDKVKESVKKAYYNVLVAEKQKSVLEETLKRLEKITGEMNQLFKQGFVEKLDVDKLQVTVNNAQTGLNQISNGISISKSVLKSTIGLPMIDSINLMDNLDVNQLKSLLLVDDAGFDYDKRSEISLLNTAKKLQGLNKLRQEYGKFPTVAAFINFTRNGQRNAKFNPNDPWFFYNTGIMGLSINQPIFDGGQRKQRIQQAKLSIDKIDNSINQVKKFIDLEKNIAKTSLSNAILNLEVQERNINLAQSVFNTTKKKYDAGVGSSLELLQAETELQRAQGGYFQALYDGYIAKTSWDKAVGKL